MDPLLPVLVTGVQGFLGARLAERLEREGHRVVGLDCRPGPWRPGPAGRFVLGDVRDAALLDGLVPEGGLIAHLASVVGVVEVLRRPRDCWSVSVDGTRKLVALATTRGARLVFSSSSEVYGEGRGRLLAEDDPLPPSYGPWPRASYPEGKRRAEACVLDAGHRVARLFNASGPGQSADSGMVVPTFVRACLHGLPLPIIGDGRDLRCFQHRDDAVAGLCRLLRARGAPNLVNLGGTERRSVLGLALEVRRLLRSDVPLARVTSAERYGGPAGGCRHRVPDLRRMEAELGHRARLPLARIVLDLAGELGALQRPAV